MKDFKQWLEVGLMPNSTPFVAPTAMSTGVPVPTKMLQLPNNQVNSIRLNDLNTIYNIFGKLKDPFVKNQLGIWLNQIVHNNIIKY